MVEIRVILKKAIPIINYFAGLAVLGLSGFYLLFADKYSLYDWFGPIFNILFALIMVGTDHNFGFVLRLCKFLDFFFGRGVFYLYISMQIDLYKVIYHDGCDMYTKGYCHSKYKDPQYREKCLDSEKCQDSGFFYDLYGIISFWTFWSIFGLGVFCLFIHFTSKDKQISFDPNTYKKFEDNIDTAPKKTVQDIPLAETVPEKLEDEQKGSPKAQKIDITDEDDDYYPDTEKENKK